MRWAPGELRDVGGETMNHGQRWTGFDFDTTRSRCERFTRPRAAFMTPRTSQCRKRARRALCTLGPRAGWDGAADPLLAARRFGAER